MGVYKEFHPTLVPKESEKKTGKMMDWTILLVIGVVDVDLNDHNPIQCNIDGKSDQHRRVSVLR